MAISKADFWKLLIQSGLLTQQQCQHLSAKFSAAPGAQVNEAKSLAEWLVRQRIVSKYQATILLAGRPGPFFYGDYKVYDRIEAGRLAKLFRAVHAATNHPVLLKFLAGPTTQFPNVWNDILQWIPLTAHPNIHRCYEAADLGKYRFLVLEDLRGQSLAEVLEQSQRIAADEASRLMRLAALGLSRLHENGRVHGDVRPHNLWLEPNGNLRLLVEPDMGTRVFNLANVAAEPDGLERSDYAAPEFNQRGRMPDALTDIYALGSSLYHLVAGKPPFPGGDPATKLRRHAMEAIQPLERYGVPSPLTQLIAYTMAKNPAVRYQQVHVVAEQLGPFIGAAQQNFRPTAALLSTASFEGWIQQKQSAIPAAQPAFGVPFNMPPRSAASLPIGTHPVAVAAMPVAGAAAAGSIPMAGIPTATVYDLAAGAAAVVNVDVPALSVSVGKTNSAAQAIRRRARTRRRNNIIFLALSLLAVVGALLAGVIAFKNPPAPKIIRPQTNPSQSPLSSPSATRKASGKMVESHDKELSPAPATNVSTASRTRSTNVVSPVKTEAAAPTEVVQDDGQLLWASPTHGPPISLKYVPPGVQCLLIARPADMVASAEGQRVLKALGPRFDAARSAWEALVGWKLEDVQQLIVALYGNQGSLPKAAFVAHLKADVTPDELRIRWGQPAPVEGLSGVYQKGEWAFYIPAEDKRTFVIGPLDPEVREAAAAEWKPPLLRREVAQMLQTCDSDRHVTILFAPNFLFGDGQELFAGESARAKPALQWFLGDGLKGGMVSMHFSDNFYFEMRMESDIQIDRFQLASQTRQRLSQIPEAIELYIADINPHPYWRLVANRYPGMVRFLHQQSRVGVEGNHAVVNAVLPGVAAHNLVFGGEMLLASTSNATTAAASNAATASAPKHIDELLKAKISISFAQDSLEFAMQNVVTEVKSTYPNLTFEFKIKILGPDLEKDGITRNQQVREFDQKEKSVAEVLTAMVRKANPITTVKEPSELGQKLIWVVGPDPENVAHQIVLVTTRGGAEQKKYMLPEVFRPK